MKFPKFWRERTFWFIILIIFISSTSGFLAGVISSNYFYQEFKTYLQKLNIQIPEGQKIIEKEYIPQTSEEEKIIEVVNRVSPAVVSIIITKELPVIERYSPFEEFFGEPFGPEFYRQKGTEKKEVGGATGFIISEDGMILTNKHVVIDPQADYTVLTNDGQKFSAKVLARDPGQDLAILKIENNKSFPVVTLGDSSTLKIGQSVIAIGNTLGEFRNTVSVGVISGLGRTITASGGGFYETLEDVIQTDAAINKGNSGGPLLNLKGEVIGINTAMSIEGENIGFTIPINKAKKDIEDVKKFGKIVIPYLGVYYAIIDEEIQKKYNLSVDYGALIGWNQVIGTDEIRRTEIAVVPESAAEMAGLKRDDIILEFNGEKITTENSLAKVIMKYNPGEKVVLKILRNDKEITIQAVLGEKSE